MSLLRRRMMMTAMEGEADMREWQIIGKIVSDGTGDNVGLTIPIDFTKYREIFIDANNCEANSTRRVMLRNASAWYNGNVLYMASSLEKNRITCVILNICGGLYPFAGSNTGYNNGIIDVRPCATPRVTLAQESYAMISLDTNNNGAVPEGEILTVYGR